MITSGNLTLPVQTHNLSPRLQHHWMLSPDLKVLAITEELKRGSRKIMETALAARDSDMLLEDVLAVGNLNNIELALLKDKLLDKDDVGRYYPGVENLG